MVSAWLNFGVILVDTIILANFLQKFLFFFKVKHYFGHIWGMVGPIDVKWTASALVGYWVQYVTVTMTIDLMTLTLDVSRSNFEIALSSELLVWLMWNKKEVS